MIHFTPPHQSDTWWSGQNFQTQIYPWLSSPPSASLNLSGRLTGLRSSKEASSLSVSTPSNQTAPLTPKYPIYPAFQSNQISSFPPAEPPLRPPGPPQAVSSPGKPFLPVCSWAPANLPLAAVPEPCPPLPLSPQPVRPPAVPRASSAHGHARVPASGSRHQKASPITGSVAIPPLSPDEGASSYSLGRKEHSLHFHTPACLIPFTLLYSLYSILSQLDTHTERHTHIFYCVFFMAYVSLHNGLANYGAWAKSAPPTHPPPRLWLEQRRPIILHTV